MKFFQNYTACILLVDGIVEIVNILYLNYRTKAYRQRAEKNQDLPEIHELEQEENVSEQADEEHNI